MIIMLPFHFFSIIYAKKIMGIWINHYSIFTILTIGSLSLYFINPPLKVADETLFVFIWGLFFFNITIYFFKKIKITSFIGRNWLSISIPNRLMIFTFILLIPFIITFRHQLSSGLELWQIRAERHEIRSASDGMIYLYAISPLIMILTSMCYYGLYIQCRGNKNITLIFIGTIIITIIQGLVDGGGRTGLMNWFFAYILAIYFKQNKYWTDILNQNAKFRWYLIAIPMLIIIIITALRGISSGETTFIDAVAGSYTMHILLFDWYFSGNWFEMHPQTLGLSTFESFVLFFNMICNLFIGVKIPYESVDSIIQEFRYVGDGLAFNACASMYFRFIRDWGIIGIVIGPMIVSSFLMILYKISVKNKFYFLIYLYSLSMVCQLHNELAFSKVAYFLFILYMIIIKTMYCKRQKIN